MHVQIFTARRAMREEVITGGCTRLRPVMIASGVIVIGRAVALPWECTDSGDVSLYGAVDECVANSCIAAVRAACGVLR